jgi:hypothetical protein
LSDQVICEHLAGKRTAGVYPLPRDETCHFLAADLDEVQWRDDAKAFCQSGIELGGQSPLKYHVPAMVRMPGFSSAAACRLVTHADSARPSSATLAPPRDHSIGFEWVDERCV